MSLSFKTEYLGNYFKSKSNFRLPSADVEEMHVVFWQVIYREVFFI